jgi:hypothetical protein
MAHKDKGHYARKHPPGRKVDPHIAGAVKQKAVNGRITCSAAFEIAHDLDVPPAEVGFTIDSLELSMTKCLLGLFGYGPARKAVKAAEAVSPDIQSVITDSLVDGRLPCKAAWDIAERLGIARMEVSSTCEALKIKISTCQLGAF